MHYELYIDVFFLINFMMDYMILTITGKILRRSVSHARLCTGALLGAFLTCVVLIMPIPYGFIKLVLFYGCVGVLMLKTGLDIPWSRMFIRAYALLYVSKLSVGRCIYLFSTISEIWKSLFCICDCQLLFGTWNLESD